MPMHQRKVAFSNKKKKEQLKAKRERKKFVSSSVNEEEDDLPPLEDKGVIVADQKNVATLPQENLLQDSPRNPVCKSGMLPQNYYLDKIQEIGGGGANSSRSRYNLKFRKSKSKSTKGSKLHHEPVQPVCEKSLESESWSFFPLGLSFPKRPPWEKTMSKQNLDQSENRSFRLFCEEIDRKFQDEQLSLYELNLETWRQLWRVIEMSDILLIIVDARYSVAQFPPYLHTHLTEVEKKEVILVLNKCDLVPPSVVLAWQDYFTETFTNLIVLPFSSFEGREAKKTTLKLASQSSLNLIQACQTLVKGHVDLSAWKHKVEKEEEGTWTEEAPQIDPTDGSCPEEVRPRYKNGVLTIGTIGHPNVGKSSLINALMGKKVVSVSKTPGHTKYFQTIFIAKNIKLCDCPGLVFPSLCSRQLQVIIGSYPIAQVSDPLSSIHYVASHLDLPKRLQLSPPHKHDFAYDYEFHWTSYLICEAWAKKRGYFIRTKGGRPDAFRAANELLRFTLVGFKSLVIYLKPPGYCEKKDTYSSDLRNHAIRQVQGGEKASERNSDGHEHWEGAVQDSEDDDEETSSGGDVREDEENSEEEPSPIQKHANRFNVLSLND